MRAVWHATSPPLTAALRQRLPRPAIARERLVIAVGAGLVAAVAAVVIWLLRSSHGDSARPPERSSPAGRADELLAGRFARGEIDEEEFRRQRELLHSRPGTG